MLQYHILMKRHEKLNTRASKETDPVKKQCLENRALDLLVTAVSLSEKSEFKPGPTRQRDEAYREKMGCYRSNILNYVTITHQPLLIDLKEDKKKKNKPPPPGKSNGDTKNTTKIKIKAIKIIKANAKAAKKRSL